MATSGKRELAGVEGTTDLWYLDKGILQLPFVQAHLLRNLRARGIDYPCTLYCLLVPDAPHAVEVEGPVASEDRDSKVERLGDQQPVEGVAVMERQTAAADGL